MTTALRDAAGAVPTIVFDQPNRTQLRGIDDPYEAPENPAVTIDSGTETLDESLAILRTLDAIRARWGLRYPQE